MRTKARTHNKWYVNLLTGPQRDARQTRHSSNGPRTKVERGLSTSWKWMRGTWESDTEELSKRLDSFWGNKKWLSQISRVQTLGEHWLRSDHRTVTIDWETDMVLPEKKEEEEYQREITNKQKSEKMTQENWERYKDRVKEKITSQKAEEKEEEKTNTQKKTTNTTTMDE